MGWQKRSVSFKSCSEKTNWARKPYWYIYAPWSDHQDVIALRSSRVILVGKLTGTIHYDGSAGDEG